MAVLPFSLLGAWTCFQWGCQIYGPSGGNVAGILWCLSPLVIAHGSLLTPDVAATCLGFVAIFWLRAFLQHPSWMHAAVLGLCSGAALISKFTWVMVLPVVVFLACLLRCIQACGAWKFAFQLVSGLGLAAIIAVGVIYWAYMGRDIGVPLGDLQVISQTLTVKDPAAPRHWPRVNRFLDTPFEHLPCPLPAAYVEGIDVQKRDFERGYPSYLMGEWKHGGWWYYYVVAFLVKEPIGFQILLYLSILGTFLRWNRCSGPQAAEGLLVVIPALLIFGLVSWQTGFNHHLRYALPAYPFLFLAAARTVTFGKFGRWITITCLAWQVTCVMWFTPHWMSYFNEFSGGPKQGDQWLLDSNIDWGQDVLPLKRWQDNHPQASPLNAALYTAFEPADIGLVYSLPAPFVSGQPEVTGANGIRGPQPGWYAISVSILNGHSFPMPDGSGGLVNSPGHFVYFKDHFEPVDMIGYSIYIYHITEEQAAEVRRKLLAEESRALEGDSRAN
jgi:hypothetical protein